MSVSTFERSRYLAVHDLSGAIRIAALSLVIWGGAASVSGCADSSVHVSDAGQEDQSAPWTITCGPNRSVDLSGLVLPEGAVGLAAVVTWGEFPVVVYTTDDYCASSEPGGSPDCAYGDGDLTPYALFVRPANDDRRERSDIASIVGERIDSAQEAALAALAEGYHLLCPDGLASFPFGPGSVSAVNDGYDVVAYRVTCTAGILEGTLHVSRDGEVELIDEAPVGTTDCSIIQ
ncbi:MAG: hypothetical protein IPG81_12420 [Sandaracinaceae bacterium]|jgi:hypothetical protein|nr:hypothetical protein [Sandaracinaceae bacterium]MBK7156603.1 hypothetical protein [Sandaracinaceae bacterium]